MPNDRLTNPLLLLNRNHFDRNQPSTGRVATVPSPALVNNGMFKGPALADFALSFLGQFCARRDERGRSDPNEFLLKASNVLIRKTDWAGWDAGYYCVCRYILIDNATHPNDTI